MTAVAPAERSVIANDRIARVTRERVTLRSDARLPHAWIRTPRPGAAAPSAGPIARGAQPPVALTPQRAVLIALGPDSAASLDALFAQAKAGARVYALLDRTSPEPDPKLLAGLHVMLRRVPELVFSAVLTPDEARLWIGAQWSLALDATQRTALRQLFLRMFWHDATAQAFIAEGPLSWQPPPPRPEDVPEPDAAQALSRAPAGAMLSVGPASQTLHLRTATVPSKSPLTLRVPPDGERHEALAALHRNGVTVGWTEHHLPDLVLDDASGELLLRGTTRDLRVRLTRAQRDALHELLRHPTTWTFERDVHLGAAAWRDAKFLLPGATVEAPRVEEVVLTLDAVHGATLDDYAAATPAVLPEPPPLALSVRHRWTCVPPRAPKDAAEDPLVGRWRDLDAHWNRRRNEVHRRLDQLTTQRKQLAQFPGQDGAILGFTRAHAALQFRADALPGALSPEGPAGTTSRIEELSALEADVAAQCDELHKAERDAQLAKARAEQTLAWQAKQDQARVQLTTRRPALEDVSKRVRTLRDALNAPSAPDTDPKDREAQRKRDTDALQRAERDEKRLRDEVHALERDVEAAFVFAPPPVPTPTTARKGTNFVPAPAPASEVLLTPAEALPAAGALRTLKGQRYLVIEHHAQLERAHLDAARLRASLVTPEDT